MGAITVVVVVVLVAIVMGLVGVLGYYLLQQRRRGATSSSIFPTSFKGIFGGSSESETGTRFAALDVDEAWDSHVDEEMGYDSVRMHGNSNKEALSHEELNDRYDALMDGEEAPSNPFGSGSSRLDDSNRKSAFRESM